MRKRTLLLILFFGSCWGVLEAIVGGTLFRDHVPHAAVPERSSGTTYRMPRSR